jgi:hypothetical protein
VVARQSIEERFLEFHRENPHVYAGLLRLAWEARGRGHRRYAVEELYAVLRWQTTTQTTGVDFKLNDHFTSRYARMLMQRNPELDGMFETRRLREGTEPDYRDPPPPRPTPVPVPAEPPAALF